MNDCASIRESIGTWLDGELSSSQSEAVRAHIENCHDCAAARLQLERLQTALSAELMTQTGRIELAPFWRELQQRIERKRAWYEDLLDRSRDFFTAPRLAWTVPAVIALLLAAFSLDTLLPGWPFGGSRNNFAAVESIDAYGRSVALLRQDETKTTVIWLYDDQEGAHEPVEEPSKPGPAF